MDAKAFCPAHVTGFFKAHLGGDRGPEGMGSTGAGFSIRRGVTTTVRASKGSGLRISARGHAPDRTDVSEAVVAGFQEAAGPVGPLEIVHDIGVPVGYGLGSSGAVALSLALALDRALGTNLGRTRIGEIAHNAEVSCRTGLGDVLAAFHGGFEVRTVPGAPGTGAVERIPAGGVSVIMACFSPISTNRFIRDRLPQINGLGGRMVGRLLESRDRGHFQDMSLEFARYAGVMTPRMRRLADDLARGGIRCGVAMFGETIFTMVPRDTEAGVMRVLERHPGATVIRSGLDDAGARLLDG